MDSMVIKGLDPDTNYQFAVRAVNPHGPSPRSRPSDTVRTFREYHGPPEGRGGGGGGAALLEFVHQDPMNDWGLSALQKDSLEWAPLSPSRCSFPSPEEVRNPRQGHRPFLCPGSQQKIYFCIILREFEVSFLSRSQNRPHTKMLCSLPPSPPPTFSSLEKMGSS